ncbi:MAG: hypothetical protein GX557_00645 [Chloroflexi bacterium]|nr:hypothetical protein [Chloroflexota bacterium]
MDAERPSRTNRTLAWAILVLALCVLLTAAVTAVLALRAQDMPAEQLALSAGSLEGIDLYLADARGGNRVRLTDRPGDEVFALWAPDGQTLAFVRVNLTGRASAAVTPGVYLLKLSQTGRARETLLYSSRDDSPPLTAWSPDGEHLAILPMPVGDGEGQSATAVLTIANARTGALTEHPLPVRVAAQTLSWSHDGARLAFIARPVSEENELSDGGVYVYEPGTGALARIAEGGTEVAWSPTEGLLACANLENQQGLVLVDADGANARPFALGEHAMSPSWSPDGQRLAFGRVGLDVSEIALCHLVSGEVETLLALEDIPWGLAWSPSGRLLACTLVRDADAYAYGVSVVDTNTGETLGFASVEALEAMPAWRPPASADAAGAATEQP